MSRFFGFSRRWRLMLGCTLGGVALTLSTGQLVGQQVAPTSKVAQPTTLPVTTTPAPVASDSSRAVAHINGNLLLTQEEFGRFLMDRGGSEKLELFVNKKIIEEEAKRVGVSVTKTEMEAALKEDLAGIGVSHKEFLGVVLPKYGKTYYEWMEDVIRPRLMLSAMCRQRIKVKEEDLKKQFERRYGEQRRVQMIMWPPNEPKKNIEAIWAKIRASKEEFDHAARSQANPSLASAAGHIQPITKHLVAEDKIIEETAFSLKVGEVSQILATRQGFVVLKLNEIIAPSDKVKFEDPKVREQLEKAAYDEVLTAEIPKFFAELKTKAAPKLLYSGPSDWQFTPKHETSPILPTSGSVIAPPVAAPK